MTVTTALPSFQSQLDRIAAAERGDGWLCACEDDGRFLLPSRQLVESLGELLRSLGAGPVLEVCAGRGELSEALTAAVPVVATDAGPPAGSSVHSMSAEEALGRHRPTVVLGSFVPVDAGVDEAVLRFPSVDHYVVLGARIGGLLGSAALWRTADWTAARLPNVEQWVLTRHDVWLDGPQRPLIQHGEAWHFNKAPDRWSRRIGFRDSGNM